MDPPRVELDRSAALLSRANRAEVRVDSCDLHAVGSGHFERQGVESDLHAVRAADTLAPARSSPPGPPARPVRLSAVEDFVGGEDLVVVDGHT